MKRTWTGRCRHCGAEHPARGQAWLTWYPEHLRGCEAFLALERAARELIVRLDALINGWPRKRPARARG